MNHYLTTVVSLAQPSSSCTKHYIRIISHALTRPTPTIHEKHHILPKSFNLGGGKDPANIVYLTCREHCIVHKLLSRMFSGPLKRSMQYAYWAMVSLFDCNRRSVSKYYSDAKHTLKLARAGTVRTVESRINQSIRQRGMNAGPNNPMYGKTGNLHHGYGKPSPFAGKTHTDETKLKMSKHNIMRRDPYAGSRIRWTPDKIQAHSLTMSGSGNHNAKQWQLTHTVTGEIIIVNDLKQFCTSMNWNYKSLMSARGARKPYKEYAIDILTHPSL